MSSGSTRAQGFLLLLCYQRFRGCLTSPFTAFTFDPLDIPTLGSQKLELNRQREGKKNTRLV